MDFIKSFSVELIFLIKKFYKLMIRTVSEIFHKKINYRSVLNGINYLPKVKVS